MTLNTRADFNRNSLVLLILLFTVLLTACSDEQLEEKQVLDGEAEQHVWFEEAAAARGLVFHHVSGHEAGRFLLPETVGSGAALFDMDQDGDLDAYIVQSGSLSDDLTDQPRNQLFENRGDGVFVNVTAGSGADDGGYGMGVAAGDYDNDGDVDLYVTNLGANVLLRNDGAGRFTDVTAEAGAAEDRWSSSAAFVDYDHDGDLDLYSVNYVHWSMAVERDCFTASGELDYCGPRSYDAPVRDTLLRNNGDGTFTDVSDEAGLNRAFGNGLGVVCAYFNDDDLIDIFIANDGMPDQMWINQGDGAFVDQAAEMGCAVDLDGFPKAGMGTDAADLDNDGDTDLIVVNLSSETDSLYRNDLEYFSDLTAYAGLAAISRTFTRFGVAFEDFDNDGRLDVYQANGRVYRERHQYSDDVYAEPNMVFRGVPAGRFEAVVPQGGTAQPVVATSRGAAFGDIDNDGKIDVLVVNRDAPAHLFLNVCEASGHWLTMRIVDSHGRDAFGAVVDVVLPDATIRRDVRSAYSYMSANDPRVHVGLGEKTQVQEIVVTWVDGRREVFPAPEGVNQFIELRQGSGSTRSP